jgi:hypothetical protein
LEDVLVCAYHTRRRAGRAGHFIIITSGFGVDQLDCGTHILCVGPQPHLAYWLGCVCGWRLDFGFHAHTPTGRICRVHFLLFQRPTFVAVVVISDDSDTEPELVDPQVLCADVQSRDSRVLDNLTYLCRLSCGF